MLQSRNNIHADAIFQPPPSVDFGSLLQMALTLGPDMGVAVGWSRDGTKNSLRGEVRTGSAFGVAGNWVHHFSDKSFGKVSAKIGM